MDYANYWMNICLTNIFTSSILQYVRILAVLLVESYYKFEIQ